MPRNKALQFEILGESISIEGRRILLPFWLKAFCWIFILMGIAALPYFIAGLFGVKYYATLYGLEANEANSAIAVLLVAFFEYKLLVALLLWFEAKIAVLLGIVDAVIGILVCFAVMFNFPVKIGQGFSFRLEIIFLSIYLFKLVKIRKKWGGF